MTDILSMIAPLLASGPQNTAGVTPPQDPNAGQQYNTAGQQSQVQPANQGQGQNQDGSKTSKPESQLQRETSFVDRFRKEVGSYPQMNYRDMPMADGSNQRMLVFKVGDHYFAPAIHDHNWAFENTDRIAAIPRFFDKDGNGIPDYQEKNGTQSETVPADGASSNNVSQVTDNPDAPQTDPYKKLMDLINQGSGADALMAQADEKLAQSGNVVPDQAKYKFGGPGAIATTVLGLLAALGGQGGQFLTGAYNGLNKAKDEEQQRLNMLAQSKSAGLRNEAAGLQKRAGIAAGDYNRKIQAANIAGTLDVKKLAEQGKNDRADMSEAEKELQLKWKMLSNIPPEGRAAFAQSQLGITDQNTLNGLASMRPDEILKMSQASLADANTGLTNEKTKDIQIMRPYRESLIKAQTNAATWNAKFTEARTKGQAITNEYLPKEKAAELAKLAADTDRARAEANNVANKVFDKNGNVLPTATTMVNQWSKFKTAVDKAEGEKIKKEALLKVLTDRFNRNAEILKKPAGDPYALNQDNKDRVLAAKDQGKLQNQIDELSAEISGLDFIAKRNQDNIDKLHGAHPERFYTPPKDEAEARARLAKALPNITTAADRKKLLDAFKAKFNKDY